MKWIVSYNPYRLSMLILQQKRYHVKLFFTKKIHFVCLHKMHLRYPIYLIDNIGNQQTEIRQSEHEKSCGFVCLKGEN